MDADLFSRDPQGSAGPPLPCGSRLNFPPLRAHPPDPCSSASHSADPFHEVGGTMNSPILFAENKRVKPQLVQHTGTKGAAECGRTSVPSMTGGPITGSYSQEVPEQHG